MIVDELVAILGYDVRGEAELRRFNAGLDNAQRKASELAANLIKVGAAAATAAATGFGLLAKSVVATSAQFEGYAATLETIEGSSEKARKSLDWISEFAKRTPFEVAELTEAFVRLRAYGMDPTSGLMESLGDASSAMGKSLMQAVEMIADASTGEFERLKEFGIRASQEGDKVTFSWTENGKALTKTVKKNGAEITKFIQDQFGSRFNGAMVRQSKTWNGMISNLSDTWVDFRRRIGERGFFDTVKNQLQRVIDIIGRLDADGTLDRWAQNLSDGLTKSVDIGVFALDRLQRHFTFLSGWVSANPDLFKAIAIGLGAIAAVKFPFLFSLLVLEDILSWMEGSESIIGDFAESLSQLTGIDADTIGAILAALAGGASLALAAGGITAITGPIIALTSALAGLGGGAAAAGLAILGRLGIIGAAGAGAVELGSQVSSGNTAYSRGQALIPGPEDALAWIYNRMFGEAAPSTPGPYDAAAAAARQEANQNNPFQAYEDRLNNARGNMARMGDASASGAVLNDNTQDNRQTTINTTVNQTVQQASQAPAAAAAATGSAVSSAAQGNLPPTRTVAPGSF